jgi:hypothetical protein
VFKIDILIDAAFKMNKIPKHRRKEEEFKS